MKIRVVLFTNTAGSWLFRNIHKAEPGRGPLSPWMANAWLTHQLFWAYARTDITNQSQRSPLLSQDEVLYPRQWSSVRLRIGSFCCLPGGEATALPFVANSPCPLTLSYPPCTAMLAEHLFAQVETVSLSLPCSLLWLAA